MPCWVSAQSLGPDGQRNSGRHSWAFLLQRKQALPGRVAAYSPLAHQDIFLSSTNLFDVLSCKCHGDSARSLTQLPLCRTICSNATQLKTQRWKGSAATSAAAPGPNWVPVAAAFRPRNLNSPGGGGPLTEVVSIRRTPRLWGWLRKARTALLLVL